MTAVSRGNCSGPDGKPVDVNVIVFGENGAPVTGPVLVSTMPLPRFALCRAQRPSSSSLLCPRETGANSEDIGAHSGASHGWFDCKSSRKESDAILEIDFTEPPDFQPDEYPIETTLRVSGHVYSDEAEPRLNLEKNVVVRPKKPILPPPPRALKEVPTHLRVADLATSSLARRWPGRPCSLGLGWQRFLTFDPAPEWTFQAICRHRHPVFPALTFTKPTNGQFEALVHTPADYFVSTKLEFELQAIGPGSAMLNASFTAEVVLPPGPRKILTEIPARGQRRPPYKLVYVEEKDFEEFHYSVGRYDMECRSRCCFRRADCNRAPNPLC